MQLFVALILISRSVKKYAAMSNLRAFVAVSFLSLSGVTCKIEHFMSVLGISVRVVAPDIFGIIIWK